MRSMSMPLIRPRASPVSRLYCVSSLISMIRARSSLSWSSVDSPSVTRTPSSEFCTGIAESGRVTMLRVSGRPVQSAGGELPGRGQHLGSDVVDVAFAEQPGGGPVGQCGVQALEPGLDDRGVVAFGEQR